MSIEKIVVEVEPRTDTGKGACRRMRAAGRVPANVYGLNRSPFSLSVVPSRIEEVLRGEAGHNAMLTLSMQGGKESREVMMRELQRDPVTERLVHIDFVRVDVTQKVQVDVPLQLQGLAAGVKNEGGVLDFVHRFVQISCLPTHIPGHMDLDVSALNIGQHISAGELELGEGLELLDPPEMILVVVSAPRAEEEPEVAEGEEDAEAADAAPEADGDPAEPTDGADKG